MRVVSLTRVMSINRAKWQLAEGGRRWIRGRRAGVLLLFGAIACQPPPEPPALAQGRSAAEAPVSRVEAMPSPDPDDWFRTGPCCSCVPEQVVTLGQHGRGLRVGSRYTGHLDRLTEDELRGEVDLKSNPYKTFVLHLERREPSSRQWRVTGVWGCDGPAMSFLPE